VKAMEHTDNYIAPKVILKREDKDVEEVCKDVAHLKDASKMTNKHLEQQNEYM
jgi:hypothetical protein